jgi:DnaJ-domain-containing protein 1
VWISCSCCFLYSPFSAYKVLRDPQSRGEHLLQLNGLDTHELSESGTISDMDFLTEIMELQEKIDTALAQEDTKTLQSERSRAERAVEERTRQLSSAFATGNLTAAKDLLVKLSYYQRALSRC